MHLKRQPLVKLISSAAVCFQANGPALMILPCQRHQTTQPQAGPSIAQPDLPVEQGRQNIDAFFAIIVRGTFAVRTDDDHL